MRPIVLTALCIAQSHAWMKAFRGNLTAPPWHESRLDPSCYSKMWPEVRNCHAWWENETHRMVEGNSIPPHDEHGVRDAPIQPYCPAGAGQPYCLPEEGDTCPFLGMLCPSQPFAKKHGLIGDVPAPVQIWWAFPKSPDPTLPDVPRHIYNQINAQRSPFHQHLGVHLNGVHIKGPGEAVGFNVDTNHVPLLCGGHVTPPKGPDGTDSVYHYHKPSACTNLDDGGGKHANLQGYALDGFGLYGVLDIDGTAPVVDECNGHFGPMVAGGPVTYHYHVNIGVAPDGLEFEHQEPLFHPYWIGCQGPSLQKCNSTRAKAPPDETDMYHSWCGTGCGYDLCVQPGTSKEALQEYLEQFPEGMKWLSTKTINPAAFYYPAMPPFMRASHGEVSHSSKNSSENDLRLKLKPEWLV